MDESLKVSPADTRVRGRARVQFDETVKFILSTFHYDGYLYLLVNAVHRVVSQGKKTLEATTSPASSLQTT